VYYISYTVRNDNTYYNFFISRDGNFAVKRSKGRFNKIPSDQCIEQTINRDQKCSGGIIGFCTSESGVQRWVLTSHVAAKCISRLKTELTCKTKSVAPKDLSPSRIQMNNIAVDKAFEVLSNWGNPFMYRESLINISSGIQASDAVQKDIIEAGTVGESCCMAFINKRLKSTEMSFYDPIKRLSLKTFANMKLKKEIKLKGKNVTLSAERNIFGRLLAIAKDREGLSLKQILTFSLSPIPWCFGLPDGGLVKTVKSKLLGKFVIFFRKM